MLKGKAKFYIRKQQGYPVGYIYVSGKLVTDSQFPFQHLDKLKVEIIPEKGALMIKKDAVE